MNLFGKIPFLGLWKILFLYSKQLSLLSTTLLHVIYSLCFDQNQIKKELAFFDQNHGLTPLENWDFWDFEKFRFYTQKTVSFLSRTLLNLISSLVLTKTKKERIGIFWPKAWVNPFGKLRFLDFKKFCSYTQKTVSFPSRTLLNLISLLLLTKNK